MRTVHKFSVEIGDRVDVEMPTGAQVIHVGDQAGLGVSLEIWAIVDPNAERERRPFAIVGTGHPVPVGCRARHHLATSVSRDGALVWHVFDLGATA